MPLAILFAIFAVLGLMVALLGHAARANSAAPSMYSNDASPIGYAIFVVCGLVAAAAWASAT